MRLRALTMAIYTKAAEYALSKGVILADTKFEFGLIDGVITLADEVLTPDSSRYWPAEEYRPGRAYAELRQAVCAGLPGVDWVEQAGSGAGAAGGGGGPYPREVPAGVSASHRARQLVG